MDDTRETPWSARMKATVMFDWLLVRWVVVFDGTAREKTGPKNDTKFWWPWKAFNSIHVIEWFLEGVLVIESSSKFISGFSNIFLLLRKYCQLTRPMSAGEKIEPNFRFNDMS